MLKLQKSATAKKDRKKSRFNAADAIAGRLVVSDTRSSETAGGWDNHSFVNAYG
jgi:hypothetical protein